MLLVVSPLFPDPSIFTNVVFISGSLIIYILVIWIPPSDSDNVASGLEVDSPDIEPLEQQVVAWFPAGPWLDVITIKV